MLACSTCGKEKERLQSAYCRSCTAAYARARRAQDPERYREAQRRWQAQHPEKVRENNAKFYLENREREIERSRTWIAQNQKSHRAATRRWRSANKGHHRDLMKAWQVANADIRKVYRKEQFQKNRDLQLSQARAWKRANPDRTKSLAIKRLCAKRNAVPLWADLSEIEGVYTTARKLRDETGLTYHVDHIVPLQSKWVCGLHCKANLQVLPASAN